MLCSEKSQSSSSLYVEHLDLVTEVASRVCPLPFHHGKGWEVCYWLHPLYTFSRCKTLTPVITKDRAGAKELADNKRKN